MKKILLTVSLVSSMLFSVESDYEVSAMVGSTDFNAQTLSGASQSDRTAHLGLRFNNFTIKPQIALEYLKEGVAGSGDIYRLAVNGVYEKGANLKAYVLAGAGYEDIENATSAFDSGVFANVGIGAKYPVYKNIQLQAEGKIVQRFDGFDRVGREYVLLGGLNVPFGNVRASEVKEVAVAPLAAAVVAPLVKPSKNDSDSDGVRNSADKCPNTKAGLKVNSDGCSLYQLDTDKDGVVDSFDRCPATPADLSVNSIGCQNDFQNINFNFNTTNLLTKSRLNIAKLVSYLKSHSAYSAELVGHTDNIGTVSANQALSERRATKVKSILVNNGISSSRISTLGLGENSPIAPNDTESNRLKNRRVEVTILK